MYSEIAIGSTLITFHILLVVFLVRNVLPMPFSPMIKHILSAAVTIGLLVFFKKNYPQINIDIIMSILLFGFSCYFFVFGAVYKSLSLRFLLLVFAQNGSISVTALNDLITQKTFSDRVQLLCRMGLVLKENEKYKLSDAGKRQLRRIKKIRKLFRIQTIGLYATNKREHSICSI